ncbi:MAG: Trk system potassium transporter TrkA [Clostridiales bacterium]|nr:Trk system potassium transporter TrkA [Clostridiales bacterium]
MKIVIVGDGKVGYLLTQLLCKEEHEVVVIDNDAEVLAELQKTLDVAIVQGNGATVDVQREAGVQDSDLLIAATSGDEINLLCCVVAKLLGCKHTVVRVRNPEYDQQIDFLRKNLGLSLAINPEKAAAREIFRLLQFPSFLKRDSFAGGRVELVEWKLPPTSALVGKKLGEISDTLRANALICAVDREGVITIPDGSFVLEPGDRVTVSADSAKLVNLIHNLKLDARPVKNVMIIGGGRIAVYLAAMLTNSKVDVTIIEQDAQRCEQLSAYLPEVTILHGNGTQQDLLFAEGIRETDAVVTLTGMDEENLIVSMFANSMGVPKTITKINRIEYVGVLNHAGLDTLVSPKMLVADEIMRYVRAVYETGTGSVHKAGQTGTVETLYRIVNGKAEALGFTVPQEGKYLGVPLSELHFRSNILLASIIRAGKVIVPKGADVMQPGDSVVVITTSDHAIASITDIFLPGSLI